MIYLKLLRPYPFQRREGHKLSETVETLSFS